jgi:hypothetical protein
MTTYNDVKEYYEFQLQDYFFTLRWSDVQEVLEQQGADAAIELIRRESIQAYRREEAAAGII